MTRVAEVILSYMSSVLGSDVESYQDADRSLVFVRRAKRFMVCREEYEARRMNVAEYLEGLSGRIRAALFVKPSAFHSKAWLRRPHWLNRRAQHGRHTFTAFGPEPHSPVGFRP